MTAMANLIRAFFIQLQVMRNGFLGKNKNGGRPAFKPTNPMRNQVEIAAAAGVPASEIATVLGIARQTLETHFAGELRHGRVRKLVQALCLLERGAKRGSVSAAKFLVGVYSQQPPVQLGKKERQRREAQEALRNSPWADILATPEIRSEEV